MEGRIQSSVIYAFATLVLANYFDGYYALDLTGTRRLALSLLHISTAGACLFAVAFVLSLFNLRSGIVCGLAASALAWPYFGMVLPQIPWRNLIDVLPYSDWLALYAAILILTVSTAHSVVRCRILFRAAAPSLGSGKYPI